MPQFTFRWPDFFGVINYPTNPSQLSSLTWAGAGNKTSMYHGPFNNAAWRSGSGRSILYPTGLTWSNDQQVRGVILGNNDADSYGRYSAYTRCAASGSTINDAYFLYVPETNNWQICKFVGGSFTVLATVSFAGAGISPPCQYLLETVGTTTRVKLWGLTEIEPASWVLSVTDASLSGPGFAGIGTVSAGARTVLSDFSIGTGGDPAPSLFGLLEGTVNVDVPPPSPVERVVRAVARDNLFLRYETTSAVDGTFRLFVNPDHLYSVFVLDEELGDFNALIADKITPILL